MVRDYFASDLCRYRGQYDPDAKRHRVEQSIRFPDIRLATIVGELVHDLRSALDHLAWCLVTENGGTPDQDTTFPILKKPPTKDGVRVLPNVSGGVSDAARTLIERAQPYWPIDVNVEYDALWLLHRLSNIDKHRHIPIQGVAVDHFHFGSSETVPAFTWHSKFVDADEHRAELRIVPDDPAVDVDGTFEVFVVVAEPPGHPPALVDILDGARQKARRIVAAARTTCFTP